MLHAVFLINRLPTPVLKHKSPFELLHDQPPTYLDLKVFGCFTYASTLTQQRHKLDPRSRKCIFLGFRAGVKGYVLFDLITRETFISRNAIFYESHIPFSMISQQHDSVLQYDIIEQNNSPFLFDLRSAVTSTTSLLAAGIPPDQEHCLNPAQDCEAIELRRSSTQVRKFPSHLQDFHCNSVISDASNSVKYPLSVVLSYAKFFAQHRHFISAIIINEEPKTYKQAIQHPQWVQAMNLELEALLQNKTWIITDLPIGKRPIGCKWVFKIKYNSDGSVERHKARLVAKGYIQVEEIDFFDTFSPVAKLTTIRLLLAIASSQKWHLHQLGVHNAFLHGHLEEEIYMQLPPGLTTTKPNQVCRLLKSLYGLKQSSRQWYACLSSSLISKGFSQSASDSSLFTTHSTSSFTAILICVDDLILTGNDLAEIAAIKEFLNTTFKIKDLGYLKYFLGLKIARSKDGLLAAKLASTPMPKNTRLSKDQGTPMEDPESYIRLIVKFIYLTTTRPNLSFAYQ